MKKIKLSRPIVYALVAAVVAVAYVFLTEETAQRARKKLPPRAVAQQAMPAGFLKEDFEAKFEPVDEEPKAAFQPLIVSDQGTSRTDTIPSEFPSSLTGGDPNWMYTGMAEIDGRAVGLLENQSTGEGAFVRIAELWKQAEILQIEPMNITVRGTNGKVYVLAVREVGQTQSRSSTAVQGSSEPVMPNLRGPIGGVEVIPTPSGRQPNGRGQNIAGNERSETLDAND